MPHSHHFRREAGEGESGAARSLRSGFVTVTGRGAQLVLQLGLAIILARILTPEDFGVQAMVFPLALLVQGIANSGVQSAIIQRDDLDHTQSSALFWASMRWNALLCTGMAVASTGLLALYRDRRVLGVAAVWAVVIFGATLSAIHEALLKRQFRFGAVLGAHLAGLVLSIIVAVTAAKLGARYWTFVVQLAVVEFTRVAIVWVLCPWRPLRPGGLGEARHTAAASLQAYWRGFAGARLAGWFGEQADRLTVGAIGGAPMLGLYDAAKRWGTFSFIELTLSLSEVAIASLSAVRRDAEIFARYVRNAFLPVLAASLPVVGFLFAEPRGVLRVVLGEQWVGAALMLQAICASVALGSIARLVTWVTLSTGETDRQFRWTLVSTPVFLVAVLTGARWGAVGVAVGVAVAQALTSIPAVFYLLATTSLRPRDVLHTWAVPLAASGAGVLVLRLVGNALPPPDGVAGLAVRGAVFGAAYLAAWLLIPGGRAMLASLLRRPRVAWAAR